MILEIIWVNQVGPQTVLAQRPKINSLLLGNSFGYGCCEDQVTSHTSS